MVPEDLESSLEALECATFVHVLPRTFSSIYCYYGKDNKREHFLHTLDSYHQDWNLSFEFSEPLLPCKYFSLNPCLNLQPSDLKASSCSPWHRTAEQTVRHLRITSGNYNRSKLSTSSFHGPQGRNTDHWHRIICTHDAGAICRSLIALRGLILTIGTQSYVHKMQKQFTSLLLYLLHE